MHKREYIPFGKMFGRLCIVAVSFVIAGCVVTTQVTAVDSDYTGWDVTDGNRYWYENGVKQGTEGRGKEIYDPDSNAWYWLDAVSGGAMAAGKDLYQESMAGQWAEKFVEGDWEASTGKWVRYDENGHMVKGWYENENGKYYFDETFGTMAKGYAVIKNENGQYIEYYFDTASGVLLSELGETPENGWKNVEGIDVWYENHIRQGYSIDASYRGKEIYDAGSDAWYWLDNVDGGKKATGKDVYQESKADDDGNVGKWVRYDADGHMIKGWSEKDGSRYYFDTVYGTMYKGSKEINGEKYRFDENTGAMLEALNSCNLSSSSKYYKYELAYKKGNTDGFTADDYIFYEGLKACLDSAYSYDTMYEREKAVHDWIVLNCAYDYDNYLNNTIPDCSYRPEGVFAKGMAVCNGYTEAFKLCMDIIGIPCKIVIGTANGGEHAWNVVKLEEEWYMVDVTWDDPVPDEKGYIRYMYFNVTDEELRYNHKYTCDVKAQGTKYNYFKIAARTALSVEEYVKQAKELLAKSNGFEEKSIRVVCCGSNSEEADSNVQAFLDELSKFARIKDFTREDSSITRDCYIYVFTITG